ncbi:MAG: winged helix-turn-helix domain-containing protein [Deltaproteobacteria bacterium]|nr:winged helix-turn-helix domain-containing protein [Deltaproteobacteria bacterium]
MPPRQALQPATAVDACADILRARVVAGEVPPGGRFPPERELAEQLGVDRGTLRTALQRLVQSGLLSQRQGSGTVVLDYRATGGPDLLLPLLRQAKGSALLALVDDLLLLRRHLAGAVLERLADGVDDEALAEVTRAVDAFAALVDQEERADDDAISAADVAVLAAVVRAARRPVLSLCVNPLVAVLGSLPILRAAIVARAVDSVVGWRLLQVWLAAPDRASIGPLLEALRERDGDSLARVAAALGVSRDSKEESR